MGISFVTTGCRGQTTRSEREKTGTRPRRLGGKDEGKVSPTHTLLCLSLSSGRYSPYAAVMLAISSPLSQVLSLTEAEAAGGAALLVLSALPLVLARNRCSPGWGRFFLCLPYMALTSLSPMLVPREQVVLRAYFAGHFMWWANFKLVAFCCGRGPLSGKRSPTVWAFASVLLLPMSPISESEKKRRSSAKGKSEPVTSQFTTYLTKGTLKVAGLAICVWILEHLREHQYGNWIKNLFFSFALYYLLGVFEDLLGSVSANLVGIEVERSFNKPFLSTSLKEFWAVRWNQHVAKLLKVVVYEPIVEGSLIHKADSHSKSKKKSKGRRPMPLHVRILGTLGTFVMSGIMHEIVFVFVEGILVHLLLARSKVKGLPKWLSIPLTLSFLLATGDWHFFKPLRVHGVDVAVLDNVSSIMNAIVNIQRIENNRIN